MTIFDVIADQFIGEIRLSETDKHPKSGESKRGRLEK
jgi:hypothetical protein